MNVRFAGFGGQGIIMAGYALGRAGLLDGKNALQTQSYGSESRGGTCKSDVVIFEHDILELAPATVDALVVMSQPAFEKFLPNLRQAGTFIYDKDLVKPDDRLSQDGRADVCAFGLTATDLAHQMFGRDVVANVIMLGFFAGVTHVVGRDSLRRSIAESVPPKTVDTNLAAFDEGYERGTGQASTVQGLHPSPTKR
jgi:2-oxoglutarate ferredoxin oxidoreductase subunit gamma